MLRIITAASTQLFHANSEPRAERMLVLARESGMAPSNTPCGQRYLQKKGFPMPTTFTTSAGRRKTITTKMRYFR